MRTDHEPPTGLPAATDRPTLTVDEVAAALGISRSTAYQAAATGELPVIRVGRRLLVPTAAVRRLVGLDPS